MDTHHEPHRHHPVSERISETAGGVAGGAAGATLGLLAGPLGAIVGAIAGAVGGWWAGHTIAEAAAEVTPDDDEHFRAHYAASASRGRQRRYEHARPAYHAGYLAARNPANAGRDFDEAEEDFRRGWSLDLAEQHGEWTSVRDFARAGYERGAKRRADDGGQGSRGRDLPGPGPESGPGPVHAQSDPS